MPVLTVTELKKIYGSRWGNTACTALNGVGFEIEPGEFVGIMGPSGAGKTTLLNLIAAIDRPTAGTILFNRDDITKLDEHTLTAYRRERLGFIFQDFNLLDTLTVKENIILPLSLSRRPVDEIEKSLDSIAASLGLKSILDRFPYELSSGQQQRTAAARAVIANPGLILADEPTGALDSKSSRDLLQCLCDLNENRRSTILMVTHDAFAASYCKRIIFIKDGVLFSEIIRSGTRKDFFHKILDVLAALGGDMGAFV